eukprot:5532086-Pleurochrysis_carterae.AAC.1
MGDFCERCYARIHLVCEQRAERELHDGAAWVFAHEHEGCSKRVAKKDHTPLWREVVSKGYRIESGG